MKDTPQWEAVASLAERQHAVVTARQLTALGVDRGRIERNLASGRLLGLYRGVYRVRGAPPTLDQAVYAAVVANGDDAVGCGLTCGRAVGLPVPVPRDGIHVLRSWQAKGRQAGVVTHRTKHLRPEDRTLVRRIPMTSVVRTVLDISAHPGIDAERMQWVLDVAVKDLGLSLAALERRALELPGGPGRRPSVVLRALRDRAGRGAASSPPERRIAQLLVASGFDAPEIGHPVFVDGRFFELDLAYPVELIDIEYQGIDVHATGVRPITRDARRTAALKSVGYDVVEITGAMSDDEVVSLVAAAFARSERRRDRAV